MKRIFPYQLCLIVCLSFVATSLYPGAAFAETCEPWIAKAVSVEGNVEVQRAGETSGKPSNSMTPFAPATPFGWTTTAGRPFPWQTNPCCAWIRTPRLPRRRQRKTRRCGRAGQGAVHFFSRIRRNLEVVTGFVNAGRGRNRRVNQSRARPDLDNDF